MRYSQVRFPHWIKVPLSLYAWAAVAVVTVIYFILGVTLIFPVSWLTENKRRQMMHGVARNWARAILATSPVWRFSTRGLRHIKKREQYIVVSNHQSLVDILVLLAALPVHFKFIAKEELFRIPFAGWHMALAGYIPVDRKSRESAREAMIKARERVQYGASLLFFPEGTRSPDGEIHDFKMGAFKIAQNEKVAVLPVVIDGTGRAIPKKSWMIESMTHFHVSIGKPMRLEKGDDLDSFRKRVREEMAGRLQSMRGHKTI